MSGVCYRCGFCGKEFSNDHAAQFLEHMRACSNGGVTSAQTVESSSSSEEAESVSNSVTLDTDTRSESSSLPRKRGRPSKLEMIMRQQEKSKLEQNPPKQQTVFLNRKSTPKPKSSKLSTPNVAVPERTPLGNSNIRIQNSPLEFTEEMQTAAKEEILTGSRVSIVRIVTDPEIDRLIKQCMESDSKSALLPPKYASKPTSFSKPKMKTVSGMRVSKAPSVPLFCKLCGERNFESNAELESHYRNCSSDTDFHKSRKRRGDDSDGEYRPSKSKSHNAQVPDIPPHLQCCAYCRRPFDMWTKLRRHLLQNCPQRRRLAQYDDLPEDDQLKMVEDELFKKRLQLKNRKSCGAPPSRVEVSPSQVWICDYCQFEASDYAELSAHLRKCFRRLQLIEDDELLAPDDQLNKIRKIPPAKRSLTPTNSHRNVSTPKGGSAEPVVCPNCSREFAHSKALKIHAGFCNKTAHSEPRRRPVAVDSSKDSEDSQQPKTVTRRTTQLQRKHEERARPQYETCTTCGVRYEVSDVHSCSPVMPVVEGFQGEQNLFMDDGQSDYYGDHKTACVSNLLEELADMSPMGDDLLSKALEGRPLEMEPPPAILPIGVELVEVFDSDGFVFQVPYDTRLDADNALVDVIGAISTRQTHSSPSRAPVVREMPTERSRQKVEQKVTPQKSLLQNHLFNSSLSSPTDSDSDYELESGTPFNKSKQQQSVVETKTSQTGEAFVASADWIRRQNAARMASGGRRVKASTRYLE